MFRWNIERIPCNGLAVILIQFQFQSVTLGVMGGRSITCLRERSHPPDSPRPQSGQVSAAQGIFWVGVRR